MAATMYAKHLSNRATPQSEAVRGKAQVKNDAGGYVFAADCWTVLDRFLILGCANGTFYAGERKLSRDAASAVLECARKDHLRLLHRIAEISEQGRAPKNDEAIFALALLAADPLFSDYALTFLNRICRTGTHLFTFITYVTEMRGWGRSLRKAVANWYLDKTPSEVAWQVTKYQQRNGWSHRDLLRLSHPAFKTPEHNAVFRYVTTGFEGFHRTLVTRKVNGEDRLDVYGPALIESTPDIIRAFEEAKTITDPKMMARLITEEGLAWEHVPTHFLKDHGVWDALLGKMGITALIRNLGRLTAMDFLKPMSARVQTVVARLTDPNLLAKGKVHPMQMLLAADVYSQGHGDKGKLTWKPVTQIIDALNDGFYTAFKTQKPTGKRLMLALDCSASMDSGFIAGTRYTARTLSGAMALATMNVEPNCYTVGFTNGPHPSAHGARTSGLTPLDISPKQRLKDVCETMKKVPFGGTNCALPILMAIQQKLEVDCFVIYTDNEAWAGSIHPFQALRDYRKMSGINAKMIVNAMCMNNFTIADPSDAGMMDVVGFDSAAPAVMQDFYGN